MLIRLFEQRLADFFPAQHRLGQFGIRLRTMGMRLFWALYIWTAVLALLFVYAGDALYKATNPARPAETDPIESMNINEELPGVDPTLNDREQVWSEPDISVVNVSAEATFPVYVFDGHTINEIWSSPKPVRELLLEEGYTLNPNDRVEPQGTIYRQAEIHIFREDPKVIMHAGDQWAVIRNDRLSLDRGRPRLLPAGEDGEEGINSIPSYKIERVVEVTVTAYCPGTPGSGCPLDERGFSACTEQYNDGFTYTGREAVQGKGTVEFPHIVAVDPREIPLAGQVYLEGIGFAVAEDIGGAIQGHRIDLLFNLHQDALNFGRQKGIKMYVLSETG